MTQRTASIKTIKRNIAAMQEQLDNARPQEELEEERRQLQRQMVTRRSCQESHKKMDCSSFIVLLLSRV